MFKVAAAAGGAVLLGSMVAGAVLLGTGPSQAATTTTARCAATVDPAAATALPAVAGYGGDQLANAAAIMNAAVARHLDQHAQVLAVMTAMGESGLHDLGYGDAVGPDSRGLFQQRASWGTEAQRMDPATAAGEFFDRLVTVTGWQTMDPSQAAHEGQVNADPDHYTPYYAPAGQVVAALSATSTSCVGVLGSQVVAWAKTQLGKPYVWGTAGPATYDCSGLTQQAWAVAGVDLPHDSRRQYIETSTWIALDQLQPGDLVFWASGTTDPTSIYHVAIWAGDDTIIEAPATGTPVRVTPMRWAGVMPAGVRP